MNLDELPAGSVVYVGRDSFRMEVIGLGDELAQGIVQPVAPAVTAPYGQLGSGEGRVVIELDRAASSASWRAPDVRSLFGSGVDVPLLAAPTGADALPAVPTRRFVEVSRVGLAGVVALVFAAGLATASLVIQPPAAPAPVALTLVAPTPVAPAVAAPTPTQPPAPALETIAVPTPVKIVSPRKVRAARAAPPAPVLPATPSATAWVDPFAE